ncbi:MAG: FeoB-associated Cys-rich membrane protein [Candidatus Izemoplasmataceae bacterium]
MINGIIILILATIFGLIIYKLLKDKANGCGPSCSGCPIAKTCNKINLDELRASLHK